MASDALNKIKKAESDAQLSGVKAKEESDKLIAETEKKCKELIARKTEEANKEAEKIFNSETESGQKEINLLTEDFTGRTETLQLLIKRNSDKAVEAVINYFLNKEA